MNASLLMFTSSRWISTDFSRDAWKAYSRILMTLYKPFTPEMFEMVPASRTPSAFELHSLL